MCGIYGWHLPEGKVIKRDQRAILAALLGVGNDGRGGDSWGFYNFSEITRGLGEIANHVPLTVNNRRLIAHTRKATTGSIKEENCHPFHIGHIIGAHNGMVYNYEELAKKYSRNFEVDSMHIFGHLAEEKDLDEIRGYGAIHWTDTRDPSKIYLCKLSDHADLAIFGIGEYDNPIGTVWSSDERHLKKALETANIPYCEYNVETGKVVMIKDGIAFRTTKKLSLGSYVTGPSYHGYARNYSRNYQVWNSETKKFESDGEKTLVTNKEPEKKVTAPETGASPNKLEPDKNSQSVSSEKSSDEPSINTQLEIELQRSNKYPTNSQEEFQSNWEFELENELAEALGIDPTAFSGKDEPEETKPVVVGAAEYRLQSEYKLQDSDPVMVSEEDLKNIDWADEIPTNVEAKAQENVERHVKNGTQYNPETGSWDPIESFQKWKGS